MLGLRGVGKTVLLNRLVAIADDAGLKTAKIEAPENGALPGLLAPEIRKLLYALDLKEAAGQSMRTAVGRLRNFAGAFKVKIGEIEFGLEPRPGEADSGSIERDLPELMIAAAQAAADRKTAIILFIDEVQYLSPSELAGVILACHECAQKNLPFMLVGAGLPQIAALAGNAKSYAERLLEYPEIGPLDPDAAEDALVKPAKEAGVEFRNEAIRSILSVTER